MAFPRLAGVILHPTSLPGGHGIGDLGESADAFVDFLEKAGIGLWQMLPLGPTGGANSPYQSTSSFAGNPLLVSLDLLAREGLLKADDLDGGPGEGGRTRYAEAAAFKEERLRKAFESFDKGACSERFSKDFARFASAEKDWLDDFALFSAAKRHFGGAPWFKWPDMGLRLRRPDAVGQYRKTLSGEIRFHKFCQYAFFAQWRALREYAASRNVRLIGDLPIYCAHDSADVWADPGFFRLDPDGAAAAMAGVPPDYFSATGQLWGNPVYDWPAMARDGFRWWIRRVRATLALVDILRIDHFRGFEAYWEVPRGEVTAMNGRWVRGPEQAFFDRLRKELGGRLPIIAEDLGVITPRVDKLRLDNGLPGMKVLQFAFCEGADAYLPHTYETNCVCYVATHDNDTTRGWYEAAGTDYAHMDPASLASERDRARRYLGRSGEDVTWNLMRAALSSVADTAVLLMQDVLNLPNGCRMNRPGLAEGQWEWRMTWRQLRDAPREALNDMIRLYGRHPVKRARETVPDVGAAEPQAGGPAEMA